MTSAKTKITPAVDNAAGEPTTTIARPRLVPRDAGSRKPAGQGEPITAHEISLAAWRQFCLWLTTQLQGVETTIERVEGKERFTECLDRTLEAVEAQEMADGVPAVVITVGYNGKRRVLKVAGPRWLRLHANAAGWPRALEIGYEEGTCLLHFTNTTAGGEVFTANSWGE
ncbi:MAG TPA: hypothetical protein VF532_07630 [Candidatus Angelobacter sp.]